MTGPVSDCLVGYGSCLRLMAKFLSFLFSRFGETHHNTSEQQQNPSSASLAPSSPPYYAFIGPLEPGQCPIFSLSGKFQVLDSIISSPRFNSSNFYQRLIRILIRHEKYCSYIMFNRFIPSIRCVDEILIHIFYFLPPRDLYSCAIVCSEWNRVSNDSTSSLSLLFTMNMPGEWLKETIRSSVAVQV